MPMPDLISRHVRAKTDEDDADSVIVTDLVSNSCGSLDGENEGVSEESTEKSSEESNTSSDGDGWRSATDQGSDGDSDIHTAINTVSFGALAKAQKSLGPREKFCRSKSSKSLNTGQPASSSLDDIRTRLREARERKRASKDSSTKERKLSKHAPAVQSSKRAVSRKRPIVDLTLIPKARDPRFDPAVLSQSMGSRRHPRAAREAYAFLDDYRESEIKELKAQLAKEKDPAMKDILRRKVRSTEDRMRSIQNKKREDEIMAEHKSREKMLIREGKKNAPYYLKRSELRQQALMKKYKDMGSRERAKTLERRRKKAAAKERKEMPMERRGFEDAVEGGGIKRKRT